MVKFAPRTVFRNFLRKCCKMLGFFPEKIYKWKIIEYVISRLSILSFSRPFSNL